MTGEKDEKNLILLHFGGSMHSSPLLPGWDTAIFILPFFALLGLWMFGLDELLASPGASARRRPFCQVGNGKDARMTDPDGTPWPRALAGDCGMLPPASPPPVAAHTRINAVNHSQRDTYHGIGCRYPSPAETCKTGGNKC
jgi:hypothetical protein